MGGKEAVPGMNQFTGMVCCLIVTGAAVIGTSVTGAAVVGAGVTGGDETVTITICPFSQWAPTSQAKVRVPTSAEVSV